MTGFEGIAVGHCRHITGCDTWGISSGEIKDGKPVETVWFDVNRLVVLTEGAVVVPMPAGAVPVG